MRNDPKEEFYDIAVRESSDLIKEIKKHPFNVELMNNTLDYEKFKFYLQQDFLYLVDCTRALLIIAAKISDIEVMNSLINVAKGTFMVREQYRECFPDCNLSDNHEKSKSCAAFTDFFMCAAYHNSVPEALAASYSCFNIYQIIVNYMVEKIRSVEVKDNKYQRWIDIYNNEKMNNTINEVTNITNDLYKKASESERKSMLDFFKKGLKLELAFWNETYDYETCRLLACIS